MRQVLQSAMDLLQIATGITKCDDYYKLRQYKRFNLLRDNLSKKKKKNSCPLRATFDPLLREDYFLVTNKEAALYVNKAVLLT